MPPPRGKARETGDEKRGTREKLGSVRFEERICEHIPSLRRYARALCRDATSADDLVQECLLRALRKRHLWRPRGSLRAWLFRILYRLHLNQRQSAVHRRESPKADAGDHAGATASSASHELKAVCSDVLEAVEALPREQRDALLLIALEGLSYREAARILGVPIGTVRSRIARAREAVRSSMSIPAGSGAGRRRRAR